MEVHFTTHQKAIGRMGDQKVDVNFKVVRFHLGPLEVDFLPTYLGSGSRFKAFGSQVGGAGLWEVLVLGKSVLGPRDKFYNFGL